MSEAGHLSVLAPLEGRWVGKGDGFSSTLVYEWVLPSVLLRARNEVRSDAGALIAQYEGHYVRDPAESRIVFWTVGRNGELHRGTVVPREGPLWHEATVAGGRVNGYRSVVSLVGPELHYRAQYDSSASDAAVLARAPLIYRRAQQERHARHEDNDHVLAAAMAVMRAREARDGAGLEALLSPEFVLACPVTMTSDGSSASTRYARSQARSSPCGGRR